MMADPMYGGHAAPSGAARNARQHAVYADSTSAPVDRGDSSSSTDDNFTAAQLDGTRPKGRRCEWLQALGVVLALLLAAAAMGLAGCDSECNATAAADGDQYATTDGDRYATIAKVAELNSTLAAVKVRMTGKISSAKARAASLCDALYNRKVFTTSLEKVQDVDTSGAHDLEAFTLGGATYLAVANSYNGGTTNIKSRIYRHSTESGRFEVAQEVETSGAVDWEAFTLNGATYLAVANVGNKTARNRKSRIYRHSLMLNRFEVTQEVDTNGAIDWEAFTLGGATYLAVANWHNGSSYNLKSRIYRHSSHTDQFELVQEVDTSGARDWEAFTLNGVTHLALANWYDGDTYNLKSHIYRHSSGSDQFELVQEVNTSGAWDWEAFTLGSATYLAVANWYDGNTYNLKSRIYRHSSDSDRFELVQEVDTSGGRDWEAFTLSGAVYLAMANGFDGNTNKLKSRIYRHSTASGQFELTQEVDTSGARDWKAFTLDGAAYLAVANREDGGAYNLESSIYHLEAPC